MSSFRCLKRKFQYFKNTIKQYFSIHCRALWGSRGHKLQHKHSSRKIFLYLDSKSSIQAIWKLYIRNPIVQEILKAIRNLNKIFNLSWVAIHIEIYGNESAAKLAEQATTQAVSAQFEQTRRELKQSMHQENVQRKVVRKIECNTTKQITRCHK